MSGAAASTHAGSVIVPDQFPTIQEAVDSGADEILVRPGRYAETPVLTREVALRGLVSVGAPEDSLPVLAGLLFDDVAGELLHTHYTRIERLKFTEPVRNDYQWAPFWDPFILLFDECVFEAGMHDSTATTGGQLEYEIYSSTFDGPLSIAFPQALTIRSSVFRAPVRFTRRSHYADLERLDVSGCAFLGDGSGVGVELEIVGEAQISSSRFEGFETAVLSHDWPNTDLYRNTFLGPGTCAVRALGWVRLFQNRITGFSVGVLKDGDPFTSFTSRGNRYEECDGAAIDVNSGYATVESDSMFSCGAGVILTAASQGIVRKNLVLGCATEGMKLRVGFGQIDSNVVGRCQGNGFDVAQLPPYDLPIRVRNNTSYLNGASGFLLSLEGGARPDSVLRNLGYGNERYGLELLSPDAASCSCNDWFANGFGAVREGTPAASDLAEDPEFCDLATDDVHLAASSPLVNAPGCGRIGALDVACDTTTTPVLVARFDAWHGDDGRILVGWIVHLDPPRSVHLERAFAREGPWTPVQAARESHGDLVTLVDREADPRRSHEYRLVDDRDVVLAWTRVDGATPLDFALEPPAANPGPGPFAIRFVTPGASAVDVAVFDLQGRFVVRLASGTWPAGHHELHWTPAQAGLHFVRYRFPGGEAIRRISVVR